MQPLTAVPWRSAWRHLAVLLRRLLGIAGLGKTAPDEPAGACDPVFLQGGPDMRGQQFSTAQLDQLLQQQRALQLTLVNLAVPLWRAERRLSQGPDLGPAALGPLRNVQRALDLLAQSGVVVKQYDGQPYDPGMVHVKPVVFQEDHTCTVETIVETTSPAVFFGQQIVLRGEVVVGFPAVAAPEPVVDPPLVPQASPPDAAAVDANGAAAAEPAQAVAPPAVAEPAVNGDATPPTPAEAGAGGASESVAPEAVAGAAVAATEKSDIPIQQPAVSNVEASEGKAPAKAPARTGGKSGSANPRPRGSRQGSRSPKTKR